jgi:thiamine biosynthesis lipoprotein ApbE
MKLLTCLLTIAIFFTPGSAIPPKVPRFFIAHYENVLGTSMELKVSAASSSQSEKAEQAVLQEINRLSGILSGYDPNSEFSRWMRTKQTPERISPELFEVLGLFDQWRQRTAAIIRRARQCGGKSAATALAPG